jgi:hypothetical protein
LSQDDCPGQEQAAQNDRDGDTESFYLRHNTPHFWERSNPEWVIN